MGKKEKKVPSSMPKQLIANMLIRSYPNSIVTDDDGNLTFEETVYNFAEAVCETMTGYTQERIFGVRFDDCEMAYEYIINHITSLRPKLELCVHKNL